VFKKPAKKTYLNMIKTLFNVEAKEYRAICCYTKNPVPLKI